MGKRMKSGIGGREGSGGGDSVDSGYDEYDEDNNHIITEHSTADAVKEVEDSFRPVDLPGKCPTVLSLISNCVSAF